ncbi:MAG: hypothetical protein AAFW89_13085 [Bacteroidota bacterium]
MAHISDDPITFHRIRPRIRFHKEWSCSTITASIQQHLDDPESPCRGTVIPHFATIYPPKEDQHFWSPQLTITLKEERDGTLIRGLYGPKPSIWTMYVFFYSLIGFISMIVAMIGFSLYSLGNPAPILWLLPILILVFLSLYITAYFGQKLGHKQIIILHRFFEQCLGQPIDLV